jgi:hypothetical protein
MISTSKILYYVGMQCVVCSECVHMLMELWNKDWTHTNNSDILCVEPPYIYKDPDKDYCFTFYERDPDGIHS